MITWKGGVSWANLLFYKFMGTAYCDPEAAITKRSNFCNHEALCLIAVKRHRWGFVLIFEKLVDDRRVEVYTNFNKISIWGELHENSSFPSLARESLRNY